MKYFVNIILEFYRTCIYNNNEKKSKGNAEVNKSRESSQN